MIINLVQGGVTIIICLVLQCIIISVLLRGLMVLHVRGLLRPTLTRGAAIMAFVALGMLIGLLAQTAIWSGLFLVRGEFDGFDVAFYHSLVNFATLGYGDLVMSEGARLLGALEAANGVLMFGLMTGFVYTVLSDLMERAWDTRESELRRTRPNRAGDVT